MRFALPPEWNITGFSRERGGGYLKIDSPGTMFAQVKWTEEGGEKPAPTLYGFSRRLLGSLRKSQPLPAEPPNLRSVLETFLNETGKKARKAKNTFEYKVKPEAREHGGEWTAHNFTWTGGGQGQGKIWYCSVCRRVVIAQIVGQSRDNVADAAAGMFASFRDHPEGGWTTWALYDMEAAVPEGFRLTSQKLMSGYLSLEFDREGERIRLERWGLARIALKKFTLLEWFLQTSGAKEHRARTTESEVHGHGAVRAEGRVRGPSGLVRAIRDALPRMRLALRYRGCAWECEETNKLFAVQCWSNRRTEDIFPDVVERFRCHTRNA